MQRGKNSNYAINNNMQQKNERHAQTMMRKINDGIEDLTLGLYPKRKYII